MAKVVNSKASPGEDTEMLPEVREHVAPEIPLDRIEGPAIRRPKSNPGTAKAGTNKKSHSPPKTASPKEGSAAKPKSPATMCSASSSKAPSTTKRPEDGKVVAKAAAAKRPEEGKAKAADTRVAAERKPEQTAKAKAVNTQAAAPEKTDPREGTGARPLAMVLAVIGIMASLGGAVCQAMGFRNQKEFLEKNPKCEALAPAFYLRSSLKGLDGEADLSRPMKFSTIGPSTHYIQVLLNHWRQRAGKVSFKAGYFWSRDAKKAMREFWNDKSKVSPEIRYDRDNSLITFRTFRELQRMLVAEFGPGVIRGYFGWKYDAKDFPKLIQPVVEKKAKAKAVKSAVKAKCYEVTPSFERIMKLKGDRAFNVAYAFTARFEGGYSNAKGDPGGRTMRGVTWRELRSCAQSRDLELRRIGKKPIRTLTRNDAATIFKKRYWDANHFSRYPAPVAIICFDIAVNCGPGGCTDVLDRGLKKASGELHHKITKRNIRRLSRSELKVVCACLLDAWTERYDSLAAGRQSFRRFRQGWHLRPATIGTALGYNEELLDRLGRSGIRDDVQERAEDLAKIPSSLLATKQASSF